MTFLKRYLVLAVVLIIRPIAGNAEDLPSGDDLEGLLQYFFRNPAYTQFAISPDAGAIVYDYQTDEEQGLRFHSFSEGMTRELWNPVGTRIPSFHWIDNRTVLYFVQARNLSHYRTVSLDDFSPQSVMLQGAGRHSTDRRREDVPSNGFRVRDPLPYLDSMATIERTDGYVTDFLLYNAKEGSASTIGQGNGRAWRWYGDDSGTPRVVKERKDGSFREFTYSRFDPETGATTEIPVLSGTDTVFHTISGDGKRALISTDLGGETIGVGQFDLESGEVLGNVFRKEGFDSRPVALVRSPIDQSIVGLHLEWDKPHTLWMTPNLRALQEFIDTNLPKGRVNRIVSLDPDGSRFIIESYSDTFPGELLVLNLEDKGLEVFNRERPWIDDAVMSPTRFVRIPVDGFGEVYGYLTQPVNGNDSVPVVINVIDGPGERSSWKFNPEAQFYASQGLAYLELQYRGCRGYGAAFEKDWGYNFLYATRNIAEDIASSAKWLGQLDWVEDEKILVKGKGFGAYGAVAAAAGYPELFCAVVASGGYYDLQKHVRDQRRLSPDKDVMDEWLRPFLEKPEVLESLSALENVETVSMPVLLLDSNGNTQTKRLLKVLDKAGAPVTFEELSFTRGASITERRKVSHRLEAQFIREQLGVSAE